MTKFLGYLAELRFYYLRGIRIACVHTLAVASHQHKARRYRRTIYHIAVFLYYTPVSTSYQYIGA